MQILSGIRLSIAVFVVLVATAASAVTLDVVKQRDELYCGVTAGLPGFSSPDETGRWHGLNVDICRAIAAAVLGDNRKVKYVPLTETTRLAALMSGKVDLLSMNIPWTMTIDTALGLHVTGVSFYDGQSFLVGKRLGVKSALELEGATICLQKETGAENTLADYFEEHNIRYTTVGFASLQLAAKNFFDGGCQVLSADRSRLFALFRSFEGAAEYAVLPEVISREPLGPIVRQGDDGWSNVVRWVFFALLTAEEYGVTSDNIDSLVAGNGSRIPVLLGLVGNTGRGLGLTERWGYQVIKQVGNYGEIFERSVGQQSDLKMDRGLNALWNRGGLHYAPPLR